MSKGRSSRNREFIRKVKLDYGCADCGYKAHHIALQFDHIEGKSANVSAMCCSLDRIIEEILKCDIVCANCHAVRTFNRGQYGNKIKE